MVQGAGDPWWAGLSSCGALEAAGLDPEWPVFVSVTAYSTEIGRLSLPQEQRVVANGMSQCFTVGEDGGNVGRTFWRDVHSL